MFRITDNTGIVIDTVADINYIRWGKNKVPRGCQSSDAEGIVLNNGKELYKIVDVEGLEDIPLVCISEISIDSYVMEMKNETRECLLATMAAQAELAEMIETTRENQLAIMEALTEMYEGK